VHATVAVSTHPVAAMATGEAVGQLLESPLGPFDLVCCFVTSAHAGALEDIVVALRAILSPAVLLGAAATGVMATNMVIDDGPGLVLWAAAAGALTPLRFAAGQLPEADELPDGTSGVLLLADPFSAPAGGWLQGLAPVEVAGTLVAPPPAAGGSLLALDGQVQRGGAVGVALGPQAGLPHPVELRAVVCPGSRPVGPVLTVTRAEGPMIYELGGVPARTRLEGIARDELPAGDIPYLNRGLALAVLDRDRLTVHPVAGADPDSGAIGLGEQRPDPDVEIVAGALVQFHVRDPRLEASQLRRAVTVPAADAALVFPHRSVLSVGGSAPLAGCRGVAAFGARVHQASAAVACFYDIT
jgi:small ligand-binding sensory domain FIST